VQFAKIFLHWPNTERFEWDPSELPAANYRALEHQSKESKVGQGTGCIWNYVAQFVLDGEAAQRSTARRWSLQYLNLGETKEASRFYFSPLGMSRRWLISVLDFDCLFDLQQTTGHDNGSTHRWREGDDGTSQVRNWPETICRVIHYQYSIGLIWPPGGGT